MKQHPDALFREKLEQHTLTAPQNAWSRIEKKMPTSRNTFFIWKVAAAMLILIISIALLIPSKTSNQSLVLNDNTSLEKQKNDKVQASVIPSAPEKKEDIKRIVTKTQQPLSEEPLPKSIELTLVESMEILAEEKTESIASLEVSEQPTPTVLIEEEVEPVAQSVIVSDEATTIVLTAAEVNTKYLLPAQATSEAETTSSFRKLIDKAASFKNNTSGLAELRQKKNEMLALNTEKLRNRNEKNERNN